MPAAASLNYAPTSPASPSCSATTTANNYSATTRNDRPPETDQSGATSSTMDGHRDTASSLDLADNHSAAACDDLVRQGALRNDPIR